MDIADLLSKDRVLLNVDASCIRQIFREASGFVSLDSRKVVDALLERERLGSTGVGNGVAIPHARFEEVVKPVGVFFQLSRAIDIDASDGKAVDLFFVLLVPAQAESEHLKLLSRIARVMRSPDNQAQLRSLGTAEQLFHVLTSQDQS